MVEQSASNFYKAPTNTVARPMMLKLVTVAGMRKDMTTDRT